MEITCPICEGRRESYMGHERYAKCSNCGGSGAIDPQNPRAKMLPAPAGIAGDVIFMIVVVLVLAALGMVIGMTMGF